MESSDIIKSFIDILPNRSINLNISKACFTACKGCYNFFSRDNSLIEIEHIERFLNLISKHNIAHKVTYAGGDPLSRPDILEILDMTKYLGFNINLDTVGSPLLSNTTTIYQGNSNVKKIDIKSLKNRVDLLGIPLDGSNDKVAFMFRRGRNNITHEQIKILELCETNNIPVCINTVVGKYNYLDVENIANIITGFNNIVKWQFFQFMPIGPGYKYKANYEISDSTFDKIASSVEKTLRGSRIVFDPKNIKSREDQYLFVDSSGLIWLPGKDDHRDIYGNIKDNKFYI